MPKPGQRYTHGWKPIHPDVTLVTHVVNGRTRKALKEQHKDQTWPDLQAFFDDTDNGNKITLAHKDGKVIGGVEYYHHQGDAYVHSLHVDRSAGVKGLGTHLMQHVAKETVARPKGHLRELTVVGALTSAMPFYERLGGTNLLPHQVKALAEGNPLDEAGNPVKNEGTYNDRVKIHMKRRDGYSTYDYADLVKDGLAETLPKRKKRPAMDLSVAAPPVFNVEKVREAYNAREAKKRQTAYERQRQQRAANPMAELAPIREGGYRYCKEIWSTHLIVKGDSASNELFKVPYTVGTDGATFTFGKEVPVTEQYVELSHADEAGLLAEWDNSDRLIDLADSEHVPSSGRKDANWVSKAGGLPEFINRIAKDLMEKGMTESHAIATAVNQCKKWAAGGKDVKPQTRAKAAAAIAEWEAKKAAAHVGLSTPTRLDSGRHGSVSLVDLTAVLDRTAQIVDAGQRAAARLRVLDLAAGGSGGAAVDSGRSYSLDELATKRAKLLERAAARAKKGKAGSRKTKKSAGKKSKYVKPPKRVKPITIGELAKGKPQWSHGWVPKNDAARAAVKADPEKYAKMRKQQGSAGRSVANLAAPRGAVIDLAGTKPGQRYRHGWIPITPGNSALGKALKANPPKAAKKSAPRLAGSRKRGLVDGLTKEQHSARVDRLVAIPRSERTPEQHLAFVRSNAVIRGETPPTKTILPAGQGSGSTGRMTDAAATHPHNPKIAEVERRIRERDFQANKTGPVVLNQSMLEKQQDSLHTERGKALWPGLSPEDARHRSVQDWQYRNGAVQVGKNWQRPDWYTGPQPKVYQTGVFPTRTPDPNAPAGHVNPPVAPATSISRRQALSELDAKDRKAADRLIAGMPTMAPEHLQIAINSPSTSQKVKDAARAELAKRDPKPDSNTPMRDLARMATTEGHPHREAARVEAVTRKNASMGRAADGVTPLASAGQLKRAAELEKGSTGRSPRADEPTTTPPPPFERKTMKGHGIKHGDQIEAVKYIHGKGPTVIRGTAHVKNSSIGVHDGETLHNLGGVATKVMARKVSTSIEPALARMEVKNAAAETKAAGRQVADEIGRGMGSVHPEKFKPGEKPPVHKFMNTERLQQIAASTSLEPEAQANAAKAKEILAKRNKSTGITRGAAPSGYDATGAETSARHAAGQGAAAAPSTGGLSSSNEATRRMTERILARRAAKADAPGAEGEPFGVSAAMVPDNSYRGGKRPVYYAHDANGNPVGSGYATQAKAERAAEALKARHTPTATAAPAAQVMNPRTPTGVGVIKHPTKGGLWLKGPDGEFPIPAEAQKSTEALQKWTDDNLHRVDAEGARQRALQSGGRPVPESRAGSSNAQFALRQQVYERYPALKGMNEAQLKAELARGIEARKGVTAQVLATGIDRKIEAIRRLLRNL